MSSSRVGLSVSRSGSRSGSVSYLTLWRRDSGFDAFFSLVGFIASFCFSFFMPVDLGHLAFQHRYNRMCRHLAFYLCRGFYKSMPGVELSCFAFRLFCCFCRGNKGCFCRSPFCSRLPHSLSFSASGLLFFNAFPLCINIGV